MRCWGFAMLDLRERYQKEIVPELREALGVTNTFEVPRVTKIVLNMGFKAGVDQDLMKGVTQELGAIAGQRPLVTKARKSISNFKLREGMSIGAKVTLRGSRMYEFLDRLVNAALPRIRDFRGVSPTGFDGRGNYSLGISEQTIFPEIDPDEVKQVQGMNITIVTTARATEQAKQLLQRLGMPFAVAETA